MRALLLLGAAALVVVGARLPWFRDAEGALSGRFVLALAPAGWFAVLAIGAGRGLNRALLWLGLLLGGQAVALQLVEAGYLIGYQHYVTPDRYFAGTNLWFLLVLATQALVVGVALWRRRSAIESFVARLGGWRLALIGAAFVLTAATLSADVLDYGAEVIFAAAIQLVQLGTAVLVVASLPADALARAKPWLDRLLGAVSHRTRPSPGGIDAFAVVCAITVVAIAALLAWFVYERHPHVPDEVVYLYHARYLAEGLLWMPPPPAPAAFELELMTLEAARWYSPVPIGWPAVLAVGAFVGAAWLVNPVLAGVNVLLSYLFLRELYDRRTARTATLLLAVSPWFLFMAMNMMTHTWTMTLALIAALGTARMRRGSPLAWAAVAGIGIGGAGLIRPLEGLTIALLCGIIALPVRWRRVPLLPAGFMAVVAIAVGALTLPYNQTMTGDATRFPLMAWTDSVYGPGTNAIGFGPEIGLGWTGLDPFPGHGAVDVLVNANLNAFQVNTELLGWGTGSLLFLLFVLACGRLRRADAVMIATIAAVVGAHAFYWFSGGPDFGARYWYLILLPCIVLTARGLDVVARLTTVRHARIRVVLLAGTLVLSTLIVFLPWRSVDKYHRYRNMRPDIRTFVEEGRFGRGLVLVRGRPHPDYASAAIYNPLDLQRDGPVFAWDRDPEARDQALRAYPDRDVWIVDGPTHTGAGFRIVDGPIPARTLLEGR